MATMRFDSKAEIDATDWALLELLQANARLSFAALGRKVRLSAPAVAERMKRLEERGVIRAYRTEINLAALGRNLHVYPPIHRGRRCGRAIGGSASGSALPVKSQRRPPRAARTSHCPTQGLCPLSRR